MLSVTGVHMPTFAKTCRDLGQRRLDAIARITSREDWQRLWPKPRHAYPFTWGDCWKGVVEFGVKDFAAELGFYLDILGMSVNATWPDHAMIMSPDGDYTFTIYRAKRTSSDLNLQFMIGNISEAVAALKRRGVVPVQDLRAEWGEQSPMRTCRLRSPSGVVITLWGMVKPKRKAKPRKTG
jgi:catechol 2,3-dioxygenase-like lactoylglutathione lyase family enzyme